MAQNTTTTLPAPQMPATPASKEATTKSTTATRVNVTNGPAAAAAEIRKSKRKKAGMTNLHIDRITTKHYVQDLLMQPAMHNWQTPYNPPWKSWR
jgi:hypothetical protein